MERHIENGIFQKEVTEMKEKSKVNIKEVWDNFMDSLDKEQREVVEAALGLVGLGGICYVSYKLGKRVKGKEIDRILDATLKHCKKDEVGALLTMSTKRNKNFSVYIWK